MSPFERGLLTAFGFMSAGTAVFAMLIIGSGKHLRLSEGALSDIAQIGATLLVAYALEMSWFVKESRIRGSGRENWIGFVTGIGVSAVVGIAIAIVLVGDRNSDFWEAVGGTWMLFALGFLALLIAVLPYLLYDLVHTIHTEYTDE